MAMTVSAANEESLEAVEARLLAAAVRLAPSLGWGERLLAGAAREADVAPGHAALLWPDGVRDLTRAFARRHDALAQAALARVDAGALSVRAKIAAAVEARTDAAMGDEAALRRCLGWLALPLNVAFGLRLAWASADALWRWAGDVATDENHYTKRVLLAEILASTLAVRLAHGPGVAQAHLARRIEGVTAFERLKARVPSPVAALHKLAQALGRVRYGEPGRSEPEAP